MKRALSFLVLLILMLCACRPSTSATPSADVVQFSVARTLTAYPTQTPMIVTATLDPNAQMSIQPTATLPPPTNTSSPTNTPPPPSPVIIYIYPTVVVPAAIPTCSPIYADQFICYYYQRINARDYTTTWSLLTDAFKAVVNPESSGGYTGYVNFWNTVQRVDIFSVNITSLAGNFATVTVGMVYNYMNGTAVSTFQPFQLFYDGWRSTWMFDTATTILPTATQIVPTATYFPSTPSQFIYYYFNNINLRNYGITWSLLSDSFIAHNNPPETGGYTGYVNFWNSVSLVEISYTTVNSISSSYADVTVGMTLHYTSGLVTNSNVLYHLIYNYTIGSWQFYSP